MGHVTAENAADKIREFLARRSAATAVKSTEEKPQRGGNGDVAEIHVGLGSCCMAKGSDRLFHAWPRTRRLRRKRGGEARRLRGHVPSHADDRGRAPGKPAHFYADLTPAQARALVQRHFRPRGFLQRAARLLDAG